MRYLMAAYLIVLLLCVAAAWGDEEGADVWIPPAEYVGGTVTTSDSRAQVWGSWMATLAPTTSITFISDAGEVVMDYTDTLKIASTLPVDSTAQVILDVLIESHWVHFDSLQARIDSLDECGRAARRNGRNLLTGVFCVAAILWTTIIVLYVRNWHRKRQGP